MNSFTLCRYEIMLSCWQLANGDRPTFATLAEHLDQHYCDALKSNPSGLSLPHNAPSTEISYVNWKPE